MSKKKLNICLTFDVEFGINKAFINTNRKPLSRELFEVSTSAGVIGFNSILSEMNKHCAKGTFFVETLNRHYYSDDIMGKYAKELSVQGHDVQMHAHPCWEYFSEPDWESSLPVWPEDNFNNYSNENIIKSLNYGVEAFDKWGISRPISFRAGNLAASSHLYPALLKCGFKYASNVGLPYYSPQEKELQLINESKEISGVWEHPVTSFLSMGCRSKILTITGTSFYEMKQILARCYEQGIDNVVILTHVHEFLKYDKNKINKLNMKRLAKLCSHVKETDHYAFESLHKLSGESSKSEKRIQTSFIAGFITLLENSFNDKFL